jgi:hypothetical protein
MRLRIAHGERVRPRTDGQSFPSASGRAPVLEDRGPADGSMLEQAPLCRDGHGLRPGVRVELLQNRRDVELDGALGDSERGGDLL